ncbi:hypothetical protein K7432_014544 [Basidiobolus ranarum]|uniref:Homeobox domain-containing protein n=1 Tax=Basidiobolus ranarum TaxID=34480 RepID=A0ABR2WHD8_9FUNG
MIKTEDYLVDDLSIDPESPITTESSREVKRRNRLNPRQVNRLMQVFEQTAKPKADIRHKLAEELTMHPRAVQIWFQNRRQKLKKESSEATSAESRFPLDPAKLTLCNSKQVYTNSHDAYYGLSFSNFPQLAKSAIPNGPTPGFHTPTNAALLSGLGLVSNQGSLHSSATPLSLSHDYQGTEQSLDSNVSDSTMALLQECESLPIQPDISFSNMFDPNGLDIILEDSPPSGTASMSAASSESNYPEQMADMVSTFNDNSPFMYPGLDSFGLDLSTQIGMLQRQQSYPQSYPAKRKAYSWQDLCQFVVPASQEPQTIADSFDTNMMKTPNFKRIVSDVGHYANQYSPIIPTGLNRNYHRPTNSRSRSDPFVAESYREAKRRKHYGNEDANNHSSALFMEQASSNSSTAGGLSDMLAYL